MSKNMIRNQAFLRDSLEVICDWRLLTFCSVLLLRNTVLMFQRICKHVSTQPVPGVRTGKGKLIRNPRLSWIPLHGAKIGRAYCSLSNSRIRTTALRRLYLRVYDIAHHAQFVQTVTDSRRALWTYFTKLQLINYNILPFFL